MNPPKIICELDSGLASKWPHNLSLHQVDQLLIKGIYSQQLALAAGAILELKGDLLTASTRAKAQTAIKTCNSISCQSKTEEANMLGYLNSVNIQAKALPTHDNQNLLQIHTFSISINLKDIIQVISIAKQQGFQPWVKRTPAALKCHCHVKNSLVLIEPNDATVRMKLQWRNKSKKHTRLARLQPSNLDYSFLEILSFLWPLYYIIRPIRLVRQKLLKQSKIKSLWPYLGTPKSIIPALLKTVNLSSKDLIIDLGCGDGRVLIEAAKLYDCKGIGIEIDESLAKTAQDKISNESLQNQITIQCGDVDDLSLKNATVVFLFIPIQSMPALLKKLHKQLPTGARVIVHEQDPINSSLRPDHSIPIFTETAITVSHIWEIN